jgi:hypothetical protein
MGVKFRFVLFSTRAFPLLRRARPVYARTIDSFVCVFVGMCLWVFVYLWVRACMLPKGSLVCVCLFSCVLFCCVLFARSAALERIIGSS